jgi:Ni/Fe-hydrogenase subunit HybB-like protein
MSLAFLDRCAAGLSRPLSRLAAAAAALGIAALVLGLLLGQARAALAALDASFLFFAGLSAGSVALAAAVRIANGRWARPILPIADAGVGFFGPALGLLVVLILCARLFIPWTTAAGTLGVLRVAARLLLPTLLLFGVGRRFVSGAREPRIDRPGAPTAAVAYCVFFAIALSFWAYDLVLNLSDSPPATVVPAYYFLGAFLSGFAAVALVAAIRNVSGPDLRHDVGKLLFGFIIVWTYLLWSLFLATWYANVPEESEPLLLRWQGGYRYVTEAVLVAVFFWPFWLLFSEKLKRRRGTLAFGAATVLSGIWAERFLLVLPPLHLNGGTPGLLVSAGVTAGVAGLFLLSVGPRLAVRELHPAASTAGSGP